MSRRSRQSHRRRRWWRCRARRVDGPRNVLAARNSSREMPDVETNAPISRNIGNDAERVIGDGAHRRLADELQRGIAVDQPRVAADTDERHRHADGDAQQHEREQRNEAERARRCLCSWTQWIGSGPPSRTRKARSGIQCANGFGPRISLWLPGDVDVLEAIRDSPHHSASSSVTTCATVSGANTSRYVRTAISSTADTSPIQASAKNGHVGRLRS